MTWGTGSEKGLGIPHWGLALDWKKRTRFPLHVFGAHCISLDTYLSLNNSTSATWPRFHRPGFEAMPRPPHHHTHQNSLPHACDAQKHQAGRPVELPAGQTHHHPAGPGLITHGQLVTTRYLQRLRLSNPDDTDPLPKRKTRVLAGLGGPHNLYHAIHHDVILALTHPGPSSSWSPTRPQPLHFDAVSESSELRRSLENMETGNFMVCRLARFDCFSHGGRARNSSEPFWYPSGFFFFFFIFLFCLATFIRIILLALAIEWAENAPISVNTLANSLGLKSVRVLPLFVLFRGCSQRIHYQTYSFTFLFYLGVDTEEGSNGFRYDALLVLSPTRLG